MPNVNQTVQTVAALDAISAEMSLLKHPFYQQWSAGTLPAERLRNYAIQYYDHVAAFPRYLSALHSRCDDLETRQVLLENLIDEERGAENHPALWLKFAEAIGVTRAEVLAAKRLPAANALIETFDHLSRELPLTAGLSALYVYESQVAEVATTKIEGLQRFYGFRQASDELDQREVHDQIDPDERRDTHDRHDRIDTHDGTDGGGGGLRFFTVHRDADPYHAQAVAQLIERHGAGREERAIALEAARSALKAVWDLLDCV